MFFEHNTEALIPHHFFQWYSLGIKGFLHIIQSIFHIVTFFPTGQISA